MKAHTSSLHRTNRTHPYAGCPRKKGVGPTTPQTKKKRNQSNAITQMFYLMRRLRNSRDCCAMNKSTVE